MHTDIPPPVRRSNGNCAEYFLHMLPNLVRPTKTAELDVDGLHEVVAPGKATERGPEQWDNMANAWQLERRWP